MEDDYCLINSEEGDITIVSSTNDPRDSNCPSRCCDNCSCAHQNVQHQHASIPIRSMKATLTAYDQLRQPPYMTVAQISGRMSSLSTINSFNILSTDVESESLPVKPLVVAPSLDMLSRSPANRTGEEMAQQRTRDFLKDMDIKPFLHRSPETVSDYVDIDQDDIFPVADLSESMQVNHQLSNSQLSMLSSYSSAFAANISASGLLLDAGAGLPDIGQHSRRNPSSCHHFLPVN